MQINTDLINREITENLLWLSIKWWHKGLTRDFLEIYLTFFSHSWPLLKSALLSLIYEAPSQTGSSHFFFIFPKHRLTRGTGPQDMESVLMRFIFPWTMVNKNLHLIIFLESNTQLVFSKYWLEVLFLYYMF